MWCNRVPDQSPGNYCFNSNISLLRLCTTHHILTRSVAAKHYSYIFSISKVCSSSERFLQLVTPPTKNPYWYCKMQCRGFSSQCIYFLRKHYLYPSIQWVDFPCFLKIIDCFPNLNCSDSLQSHLTRSVCGQFYLSSRWPQSWCKDEWTATDSLLHY